MSAGSVLLAVTFVVLSDNWKNWKAHSMGIFTSVPLIGQAVGFIYFSLYSGIAQLVHRHNSDRRDMPNNVYYEPLSVEDADTGVYRRNMKLVHRYRYRLRLYVGGLLFIGLGIYFIWRTALLLLSLFPKEQTLHLLKDTRYLFVFGDSYSTTGYGVNDPHPSEAQPLSNPASPGQAIRPNWVDYTVWQYNQSVILGHDFAVWGDTVQGVEEQVREVFLPNAGQKPSWAPWSSHDSLFITWIGINDVARGLDIDAQLTLLFQLQDSLYQEGARNFVFLTVPPFHRAPWGLGKDSDTVRARVDVWNELLMTFAAKFFIGHGGTSTTIYETSKIFNAVLDEPKKYGFRDSISYCQEQDCVWADSLHPSSSFHKILAADLVMFLSGI